MADQASMLILLPVDGSACSVRAAEALTDAGVPFEAVVEHGDAPEVIARIATQRQCSGVVMGTRGQSELKSRLMGAVGMKVLHLVQVPVTFVH